MIAKLAASYLILITAMVLLFIWNPSDIKTYLTSSGVGNFATVTLAISTVVSIFILASQVDLISKDFIEDHRPYASLVTSENSNELNLPHDKSDEIFFTFTFKNTGKNIASDIKFSIKKACITDVDLENIDELNRCFRSKPINTAPRNTFGSFSLYPEQSGTLSNDSKLQMKDLQALLSKGKRIYVKQVLSYNGPAYTSGTRSYRSVFILKVEAKKMLILAINEEED